MRTNEMIIDISVRTKFETCWGRSGITAGADVGHTRSDIRWRAGRDEFAGVT